jgi:hypothetical protein
MQEFLPSGSTDVTRSFTSGERVPVPQDVHLIYPNRIYVEENSWFCVGSEVFTAVTMKNVVFWGIKTQFVPHRRHITSPLQNPVG